MKRILVLLLMLSTFLLLMSCSSDSEGNSETNHFPDKVPSQVYHQFTHNEQMFEIIPLYEEVLDYTARIKEDPSLDNWEEYYNHVVMSFYNMATERDSDLPSFFYSFFSLTLLEQELEDNTIKLLKMQNKINEYIQESIISSAQLLTGGKTTIFIVPFSPDNPTIIREMGGATGVTLSENIILLHIDPSFSKMTLKYLVAHEYNHTVAMKGLAFSDFTPLDAIILEGKADSFATNVYPNHRAPWLEPLSKDEEKIILEEISEHKDSTDQFLYQTLFSGNDNKGIPRWSNYKIGYSIMQNYLEKNSNLSFDEWTSLDPITILQGSDYRDLLK
ncbi:DUF2268 domain-containing protein [Paenibacillus paeoniae]|uniref:DUF2268 domain-containing protein n=1 Tax=Paenibacillus paeoniae TaxID=2292705 RepID=A0A371PKY0_9BACL|nr:DUF2268 domain-containing putative Zn-dependent protease [Paenibacillus paeoniae]REK76870.1 hypothetical protein DX130_07555 [Paenibacillus paeoniae]